MKHAILGAAFALLLGSAATARAGEAGDAVFADRGPWALGETTLTWQMTLEGPAIPGFQPVADGTLELSEAIDPSDSQPVLHLTQQDGTRDRRIGPFPTSGGDPVVTFFLEQTARDMAALTGGSPYYIRNRMKEALFRGGELTQDDGSITASFAPFAQDPNAARMQGFTDLTLTFVMTDPAQPIREFRAETLPATGYRSTLVMK